MLRYQAERVATEKSTRLMSKIVGIMTVLVIAVICYSVTVYGWFQASIINSGNVIRAAEYGIEVSIQPELSSTGESYQLEALQQYQITLKATGTADTGYCLIKCGQEDRMATHPIIPGNNFVFTFTPAENGTYTFVGMWGTYSGQLEVITNGSEIGE